MFIFTNRYCSTRIIKYRPILYNVWQYVNFLCTSIYEWSCYLFISRSDGCCMKLLPSKNCWTKQLLLPSNNCCCQVIVVAQLLLPSNGCCQVIVVSKQFLLPGICCCQADVITKQLWLLNNCCCQTIVVAKQLSLPRNFCQAIVVAVHSLLPKNCWRFAMRLLLPTCLATVVA